MKFKKKSKFSFLGGDFEGIIKYFFAGNASLAIFILGLICFFLLREALLFFPEHNKELQIYRKSGLEYYDLIENELSKYKKVIADIQKSFQAELNHPLKKINNQYYACNALLNASKNNIKKYQELLDEVTKKLLNDALAKSKIEKYQNIKSTLEKKITSNHKDFISQLNIKSLDELKNIDKEFFKQLKDEFYNFDILNNKKPNIVNQINNDRDKLLEQNYAKALPINKEYISLKKSARKLSRYWNKIRKNVLKTKKDAQNSLNTINFISGIIKQILLTSQSSSEYKNLCDKILNHKYIDSQEKLLLLNFIQNKILISKKLVIGDDLKNYFLNKYDELKGAQNNNKIDKSEDVKNLEFFLNKFNLNEKNNKAQSINIFTKNLKKHLEPLTLNFDYKPNADFIYSTIKEHSLILNNLINKIKASQEKLKHITLTSPKTEDFIEQFQEQSITLITLLNNSQVTVKSWRHNKKNSFIHTIFSFICGKKWVTNSSIQDKYGILPLFTGSLIISFIAIIIAIPLSVLSAIYINQISKNKEQNIVKPAIEFIGAIPSVVLGFIGIVVLGYYLKEFGNHPLLSWLPGFPINERLNMLNAGLLLGFMAIPTIFSLAEDAINNVPQAYKQASLALGASRIQTAFKVMLPCASSGIVSACLLGFGRIIGETMVVLLVAGNRISIPDFSKGLGVITQPSHTMTGIIAQELGEVVQGSIHYRALFMIGFVLFTISFIINFLSQFIIKRYQIK